MSAPSVIDATPVIIIGAGRSGTNMLRDVLTRISGFDTWPCDEINYIWRHGNRSLPTDEFGLDQARPEVCQFIRHQIVRFLASSTLLHKPIERRFVVEKTCANSLRVPFVRAALPEAKFLYLVRDGRDVVLSARSRWRAPLDIPYLAAKARYVPASDLPFYASRYFWNRVSKFLNREQALSVWGPRFEGMQDLARNESLEYLCAAQWARCVSASDAALSNLSAELVHALRYEDFVANPQRELGKVLEFLGADASGHELAAAVHDIRESSVGSGRASLSKSHPDALRIMCQLLTKHGYTRDDVSSTSNGNEPSFEQA